MEKDQVYANCRCIKCGKKEDDLIVKEKDVALFRRGHLAQNCFRYLSEDAQYMLDYKVCKSCFYQEKEESS